MKIKKNRLNKIWYLLRYRFVRPKLVVNHAYFSGGGGMIDIRYWLSRPDKLKPNETPYLVTAKGVKLGLLHIFKFGAMQSQRRKHTNTGILLFSNAGLAVNKKNNRVKLFWGGLESKEVAVK